MIRGKLICAISDNLAKQNDGFNYMLTVIDLLSKYEWAQPLKFKSA
jgi:hypothetical protein